MATSEEALRSDPACICQNSSQRLPSCLYCSKVCRHLFRAILSIPSIGNQPIESGVEAHGEQQAFQYIVPSDGERALEVDVPHYPLQPRLDVVPCQIEQAHEQVGLAEYETA